MSKQLAPKGLKHYYTEVTASVVFEDTFAYSKEEAEALAESSFYGGSGQNSLDNIEPDFEAHVVTDDPAEVQEAFDECWNEGRAHSRG